ncbi:hypothetical protein ACMS09_002750 [Cronobacter malonaticus]
MVASFRFSIKCILNASYKKYLHAVNGFIKPGENPRRMKKRQVENENKSRKARVCLIVQTLAPRHAKRLRKNLCQGLSSRCQSVYTVGRRPKGPLIAVHFIVS